MKISSIEKRKAPPGHALGRVGMCYDGEMRLFDDDLLAADDVDSLWQIIEGCGILPD